MEARERVGEKQMERMVARSQNRGSAGTFEALKRRKFEAQVL